MSSYGKYLNSMRVSKYITKNDLERHIENVTHNPSEVNPGQTLIVRIPKLDQNRLIVPNTLKLVFDLELSGDDANQPVSNVTRTLQAEVTDRLGGVELVKTKHYNMFYTYKDLWLTENKRDNDVMRGFDSSQRFGGTKKNQLVTAYGTKYAIPIDFEAYTSHSPIYAFALQEDFIREITFQDVKRVIETATVADWNYKIKNIELEYETVYSPELASLISSDLSMGKSFLYDHVQHFISQTTGTSKLINLNINVPKKSMKGIMVFFEKAFTNGTFDSEATSYQNPKISNVDVTVDGVSHKIFKKGLKPRQMFNEACKAFMPNKTTELSMMNVSDFYDKHFGLWIDLRWTEDNQLHWTGLPLSNTKDGVQLAIQRDSDTNYTMHVFVIADAVFSIANGTFKNMYVQ